MAAASHLDPPQSLAGPRKLPFFALVAGWLLFGFWLAQLNAFLTIARGGEVEPWPRLLEEAIVFGCFWAWLTPVLMWVTRQLRTRITSVVGRVAIHGAIGLAVHVMDVTAWSFINTSLGNPTGPFVELLFSLASFNMLTYGIVVIGTTALDYRDAFRERVVRAARLEAQLALAQFQSLRAQLHPHFLFNSLNAISALMHKDVERADRMLARLSELLRSATNSTGTPEIKLIDEIEFVRRYLDVEQIRFGDRFDVRIEIPAETHEALVPTMLLQPIVENAVRHGMTPFAGHGRVDIHVERRGQHLDIVVRDTGKGIDPVALAGGLREGVGLSTTRARLEKLYGGAHELRLVNVPGGGFETRVMLPFRKPEEAQ